MHVHRPPRRVESHFLTAEQQVRPALPSGSLSRHHNTIVTEGAGVYGWAASLDRARSRLVPVRTNVVHIRVSGGYLLTLRLFKQLALKTLIIHYKKFMLMWGISI
jgi:hypothetical protein